MKVNIFSKFSSQSFPSKTNLPTITTQSVDDISKQNDNNTCILMEPSSSVLTLPMGNDCNQSTGTTPTGWTTMTPQQISMWIDRRSRFLFPLAFLVFNLFYWSFISLL